MLEQANNTSRRKFIKSGMTGLAGAAIAPSIMSSSFKEQKKDRKFIYRTLGKTGIKLPIVSMGTYDATAVTKAALEAGIVHIDTSADYQEGNDEIMFGKVFKTIPRDSYVIGTSIGMWQYRSAALVKKAISPEKLREYIDGSLERLGVDFIDIYYLGGVQHKEIALHEPYLEVLKEYKSQGKLKYLGITTHSNQEEMIRTATDSGVYDVVLTGYNFRSNNREGIKSAIDYAAEKGIGIVAMKTQAGVYWDRKAKERKMINMKAALKWVLQDENIHSAIPSFKNTDQLYEALSVMEDLKMTPREIADLKLDKEESPTSGMYCSQCQDCLPQCPAGLDIPTVMRSYMYAFGYDQPAKARATLDNVDMNNYKCDNCTTCSVKCTSGFDVKSKVTDIARITEVPTEFLI